jgi:hypothetical protein
VSIEDDWRGEAWILCAAAPFPLDTDGRAPKWMVTFIITFIITISIMTTTTGVQKGHPQWS